MPIDCKLTGLSGNEIYCMRLNGLTPRGAPSYACERRLIAGG
jgi:hypothetical protein